MNTLRRKFFGVSALGIVAVLLVGSAVAVAGTPKGKGVVRGVHAEISVIAANGATAAFVVDQGKITAASAGSVTIQRADGVTVTLGLSAATNVQADVQTGKNVTVFSSGGAAFAVIASRGPHALSIGLGFGQGMGLARLGAKLKGMKQSVHADVTLTTTVGSTIAFSFDRGQVTAVSATSLTIKRADGAGVTKSISDDTKVRGKLVVGAKAEIFSQGGTATTIFVARHKK